MATATKQKAPANLAPPRHVSREIRTVDRDFRARVGIWPIEGESPSARLAATVANVLNNLLEVFERREAGMRASGHHTPTGIVLTLAEALPALDAAIADASRAAGVLRGRAADAEADLERIIAAAGAARPADVVEALRAAEIRGALIRLEAGERLALLRDTDDPELVAALRFAPLAVRRLLAPPEVLELLDRAAEEAALAAWLEAGPGRRDPREVAQEARHLAGELEIAVAHVGQRLKPFRPAHEG